MARWLTVIIIVPLLCFSLYLFRFSVSTFRRAAGPTDQRKLLNKIFQILILSLRSQRSEHSKAVLDDSLITVDTTSLDQHKLYFCTIALSLFEIYNDVMVLFWKFAWDMAMNLAMNDTKRHRVWNNIVNKQLSPLIKVKIYFCVCSTSKEQAK